MSRNRIIAATAGLLMAFNPVSAQINTSVEVTNGYDASIPDLERGFVDMTIPDSADVFDLEFDYKVFETPYKGTSTFSPYSVRLNQNDDGGEHHRLMVKAGAGYVLRPTACLIWEPEFKDRFRMAVYGNFDGFVGNYRGINPVSLEEDGSFAGRDLYSREGVAGGWEFGKCDLDFEVAHSGIYADGGEMSGPMGAFNSIYARAAVRSAGQSKYQYGFAAAFRGGADSFDGKRIGDNAIDLDMRFGRSVIERVAVLVDGGFGLDSYSAEAAFTGYNAFITPKAVYSHGPFRVEGGLKFNISNYAGRAFLISPDIHATLSFEKARMTLYADLTGGNRSDNYSDMKDRNHFFTPVYGAPGNTAVNLAASAGIRGAVASVLKYGVGVSYENDRSKLYDGVGSIVYGRGEVFGVDANLGLRVSSVFADLRFRYNRDMGDIPAGTFSTPSVEAGIVAGFNVRRRIFLSVRLDGQTSRTARRGENVRYKVVALPGFLDLGFEAGYRFARHWTVFLKGQNMLNADIRRTPLYSEKGIGVTAGVSFVL